MKFLSLEESHVQKIIHLSDGVFGTSFLDKTYVKQYVDSRGKLGIVATDGESLMGYVLVDVLSHKEFMDEVLEEKKWFESMFKGHERISLIKQIAVNKQYQNKGIASQLITKSLIQANKLSKITCCLAWKKGNSTALRKVLVKNNYSYHLTINNYWEKDSIKKKYNCAFCGLPPCSCAAEVYIKKKTLK